MRTPGTLLLSQSEVDQLLSLQECVDCVEEAFRFHAQGRSLKPGMLQVDSDEGDFHIKAGGLEFEKPYFCLKANGSFFHNTSRFAMPNIQGVILLSDGETGYPLALMDSREITRKRTGAATAVAAKYLARKDSRMITICGSGNQARIQLLALKSVFPLERALIFSRDEVEAATLAKNLTAEAAMPVNVAANLQEALQESQICVTCTPARKYFVRKEDVAPGLFIAAVGADGHGKQEIDPSIMLSSKVVADILEQCMRVGELQHAAAFGLKREDVYAELAEVVSGAKAGRTSEEEIIVFDSTGTALQDTAAAVTVYKKALREGQGQLFDFFR